MNTNTKKNAMNARNLRQIEIDKYYDIFLKRYKYQLSLNQTADSPSLDERFKNYSKIINTISRQSIVNTVKQFFGVNNKLLLEKYVKLIIQSVLKVKANILQNPTFKNMSLICTHGACTTQFFKIPNNLMICILSPLNRSLFLNRAAFFYEDFIDNLKEPHFNNSFLSNPSCYLRDTENSFLEFATTFYPGQMCNDLELSINPTEMRNYVGYYKIDPSNPNTLPDTNIDRESTYITTLSELIKYKNISGILFVTCCRSCDLDVTLIDETKKIYILETFTNILNKTIDNPRNIEYNRCNLLIKYNPINPLYYEKTRNINTVKHPHLTRHKNIGISIRKTLKNNKKGNKSLSPISPETRKELPNIFARDSTDKTKYEELNKILLLNDSKVRSEFNIDDLNFLFNSFKHSKFNLSNYEKVTNYVWSYIFYNYFIIPDNGVELRNNIVFINKLMNDENKNKDMTKITGLYFSGDISNNNLRFIFTRLNFFSPLHVLFKKLDISHNNSLMSLNFIEMPKSLEIIWAYDCNILFIEKSILDLYNLKEMYIFNNFNISFSRASFNYRKISKESFNNIHDEIERKQLIKEREFINQQLQNYSDSELENIHVYDLTLQIKFREAHKKFCNNILLDDDPTFREHSIFYSFFYPYLIDIKDNINGWEIDFNEVNKKYVKFAGEIFYSKDDFTFWIQDMFSSKAIDFDTKLFINNTKKILGFQGFEETTIIELCDTFIYQEYHIDTILYDLLIDTFPNLD